MKKKVKNKLYIKKCKKCNCNFIYRKEEMVERDFSIFKFARCIFCGKINKVIVPKLYLGDCLKKGGK